MADDLAPKPNTPTGDSPGYRFLYHGRRQRGHQQRKPNPAVNLQLSPEAEEALRASLEETVKDDGPPPDPPAEGPSAT